MPEPSKTKDTLSPSRLRERRRKARLYKRTCIVLAVLLIVGGGIGILYIPALRIHAVEVVGTQTVDKGAVEAEIWSSISGKKFKLLPKDNAFIYNDSEITSALLSAFPKIKEVRLTLQSFQKLEATVLERTPVALWCGESVQSQVPCDFLDSTGVLYEKAPDFSGSAYIKWYAEAPRGSALGSHILDSLVFAWVNPLVLSLSGEGLEPHAVEVTKDRDVRVLCAGDFTLLFALNQKPEDVLTRLHQAESSEILKNKKLTDLLYLDLRFSGNRLYYKLKQ